MVHGAWCTVQGVQGVLILKATSIESDSTIELCRLILSLRCLHPATENYSYSCLDNWIRIPKVIECCTCFSSALNLDACMYSNMSIHICTVILLSSSPASHHQFVQNVLQQSPSIFAIHSLSFLFQKFQTLLQCLEKVTPKDK